MRGHIQEYRPERFRAIWYFKGERFDTTQYLDQTPLYHRKQAERLLESINATIDTHKFDPGAWRKDSHYLFEKAVALWIRLSHCSYETLRARERIANHFLIPYFEERDIREIRRIDLDGFLNELKAQGRSPKYIYNIMGELRACLHFHEESIPKLSTFPKIEVQEKPIRWLNGEEQDRVFEFIPERDRAVFTFMRFTGCRPNEARGLLRENVHRDKGYFVLVTVLDSRGTLIENTKTRRIKPLPIIEEIEGALKPYEVSRFVFTRNGLPYTKRMLERVWNKASAISNEKYQTPVVPMYQGLKHSFGCQRLNAGFSIDAIREVMGHTSTKTTERYAKYLTDKLSPVMRGKVIHYV
jgi:integrase